jgi:hypothetical protein
MSATTAPAPAERLEIPLADAFSAGFDQGWSDGLPVLPPTPALVAEMLGGRDPHEVIGPVPPFGGLATLEKVAANAVMAGCLPSYFPVVEAAVRAGLDPRFNLAGIQPTTHVAAPLLVVSGPVVEQIGLNAGAGLFGPGNRANATIGRAFALLLWNLGGARPGTSDMSTFGNPLRYGACIGERRDTGSWAPLQVGRGFDADASTVTIVAAEAPKSVVGSRYPEGILGTLADCMSTLAAANMHLQGQMLVILGMEHQGALDEAGWSRADAQRYLWDHATRRVGDFRAVRTYGDEVWRRFWPESVDMADDDALVPVASAPEDILLLAAGGDVGRFSLCLPGWGSGSQAVTYEIQQGDTSP